MKKILTDFPAEVRADIATVSDNNGVLSAEICAYVCEKLSISIENLMVRLLPVAASYSKAPVSSFQVGAVAKGVNDGVNKGVNEGVSKDLENSANLYLGANFEYKQQALCHSVHAEQSAISNAWLHDEPTVTAIATSAAPCGHCRQFLYELAGAKAFPVLMPLNDITPDKNFNSVDLSQLLPDAFGPLDLGCERLLMEPSFGSNHLKLINNTSDRDNNDHELISQALRAANLCYAPYTQNFVGCAIQLTSGQLFSGRYAENVAHNPGLSAFSAALCSVTMNSMKNKPDNIERVVMVEHAGKSCQKDTTQILLAAINKNIRLEYHRAVVVNR